MSKAPVNSDRVFTIAAGLVVIAGLVGCREPAVSTDRVTVTIAGHRFSLEKALDDQARYKGLSDREEIEVDGGMLFVFPKPQTLRFVMRRCLVPIDLIYLDPAGRVIKMHRMEVEPYDRQDDDLTHYSSQWPALFAIELRGGSIDRLGIKKGDKIDLPVQSLRRATR